LKGAAHQIGIAHRALNLSKGVRVLAGVYHLQNVNAYDSRLKNWIRRFNGVATKYLENYLGWRRELEYFGEKINPRCCNAHRHWAFLAIQLLIANRALINKHYIQVDSARRRNRLTI
jgi:hypothetical protein